MLKLSTLKKKKSKTKVFSNFFPAYDELPLCLTDKRDILEIKKERIYLFYSGLKKKDHPHFRYSHLAVSYVECTVALKKNLWSFPFHKRGTRGYLLSPAFTAMLPPRQQEIIEAFPNTVLILFPEGFTGLPLDYLKKVKS